jgi:hypothetical protein
MRAMEVADTEMQDARPQPVRSIPRDRHALGDRSQRVAAKRNGPPVPSAIHQVGRPGT